MHLVDKEYYDIYEFLKRHGVNTLAVLEHIIALDDDEMDALLLCREAKAAGVASQINAVVRYEIDRRVKRATITPTAEDKTTKK